MEWQNRPFALESSAHVGAEIPSMMKPPERDLLYSIAKSYYTGEGCIVDAGIFLGASTACFASGLSENAAVKKQGALIHSYERAAVTPAMRNFPQFDQLAVNTSYEDLLRDTLRPYQKLVNLHIGDIMQQQWPEGEAIEILFLDILKTHSVMNHCNQMFIRSLIPGKSLIIQQDFFWPFGWWVNAWTEVWSRFLQPIDFAESTMVFLVVKPLPRMALAPLHLNKMPTDDIVTMLENPKIKPVRLDHLLAQRLITVNFLLSRGEYLRAALTLRQFEEKHLPLMPEGGKRSLIFRRLINDYRRSKAMVQRYTMKKLELVSAV